MELNAESSVLIFNSTNCAELDNFQITLHNLTLVTAAPLRFNRPYQSAS